MVSRQGSVERQELAAVINARMEDRWAEVKTASWSGQLDWERRGERSQGETYLGPREGVQGLDRSNSLSGLRGCSHVARVSVCRVLKDPCVPRCLLCRDCMYIYSLVLCVLCELFLCCRVLGVIFLQCKGSVVWEV